MHRGLGWEGVGGAGNSLWGPRGRAGSGSSDPRLGLSQWARESHPGGCRGLSEHAAGAMHEASALRCSEML